MTLNTKSNSKPNGVEKLNVNVVLLTHYDTKTATETHNDTNNLWENYKFIKFYTLYYYLL
jgi:hypothetical protein